MSAVSEAGGASTALDFRDADNKDKFGELATKTGEFAQGFTFASLEGASLDQQAAELARRAGIVLTAGQQYIATAMAQIDAFKELQATVKGTQGKKLQLTAETQALSQKSFELATQVEQVVEQTELIAHMDRVIAAIQSEIDVINASSDPDQSLLSTKIVQKVGLSSLRKQVSDVVDRKTQLHTAIRNRMVHGQPIEDKVVGYVTSFASGLSSVFQGVKGYFSSQNPPPADPATSNKG